MNLWILTEERPKNSVVLTILQEYSKIKNEHINFEEIIRALNAIGYQGPLSVEWEDSAMDREHGARESCELVKRIDFQPSAHAFDACFGSDK